MSTDNLLPLNHAKAQSVQALGDGETEFRFEGAPGLVLRVRPSGSAAFYCYYHARFGRVRRLRKMRLGDRAVMPLKAARARALEIMLQVQQGMDPAADRSARGTALTFGELFEQRMALDDRLGDRAREDYKQVYAKHLAPAFGQLPAAEIKPEAVVALIDRIAATGKLVMADRVLIVLGSTYSWGMRRRAVTSNPGAGLGRRSTSTPRDRVLTDDELRKVWLAIEQSGAAAPVQSILKVGILLGQRGGQTCGARVVEFEGLDGKEPLWRIPGHRREKGRLVRGRMKAGREQVVPLSRQAAVLFRHAIKLAGEHSEFVFPAMGNEAALADPKAGVGHIDRHSITRASARIRGALEIESFVPHDFRRCIATWLIDQGVPTEIAKLVLAHKLEGVSERVYIQSKRVPQMRRALQAWADHVDDVVQGRKRRGKVIPGPWAVV